MVRVLLSSETMIFTFLALPLPGTVYPMVRVLPPPLLPELLRFLGKYYYFVYYTAVLLCALFLPKGIVSLAAPIREKWNRLRARRAGAPAMEKGGTADGDHIKN